MILEAVDGRHARALSAIAAHPLVRATATVPDPEHLDGWLRRFADGVEHAFAIVDGVDVVGCVDLAYGTTLAFWVAPAHHGRGVATWAAARALEHAFGALGVGRVVAHALAHNRASLRVLAKLGFAHDWRLKNRDPRFSLDAFVDRLALEAPDWRRRGIDGLSLLAK